MSKVTLVPIAAWSVVVFAVTVAVAGSPDTTDTEQAASASTFVPSDQALGHHAMAATTSSQIERPPSSLASSPARDHAAFTEPPSQELAPESAGIDQPADAPVPCTTARGSDAPPPGECDEAWMVPVTPPHLLDPDSGQSGHDPSLGPYINVDAIPTGDPGSSERRIRDSDDTPADAGGSDGAFRTVCTYSHMNFDDAIVFPGQPGAAHLHTYFGNTDVTAYTTAESLLNSGNSTCRGGIVNRSAYWVPSMIDGDGTPLAPEASDFYYKTGYFDDPYDVSPFPAGLRILAGADMSDPTKVDTNTYFTCGGAQPYASYDTIPDCPAGTEELVMHIQFPPCWEGYDDLGEPVLDSPDHRSHMAYPSGGACPDTHPVRIPRITYNIAYSIEGASTDEWRLASDVYDPDLPAGLSLHADWFAGWEEEVVEEFVSECVQPRLDCHSHIVGPGRSIY